MLNLTYKPLRFKWTSLLFITLLTNIILTFAYPSSTSSYNHERFNLNVKCTDPETGRELYIGDAFTRSGQCIRVQCLDTLQIWEDSCQVPKLNGNCHRLPPANEFLDYPRCCSNYECKSSKTDDSSYTEETRTYNHYGRLLREHIQYNHTVMVKLPPQTVTTFSHTDGVYTLSKQIDTQAAAEINTNERVYDINYDSLKS